MLTCLQKDVEAKSGINDVITEQLKILQQALSLNTEIAEQLRNIQKGNCGSVDSSCGQAKSIERIFKPTMTSTATTTPTKRLPDASCFLRPSEPMDATEERIDPSWTTPLISRTHDQAKLTSTLHILFPDTEDLQTSVNRALSTHRYDVEELYRKKGCWQAIARSSFFKKCAMVVILLNMIWIGFETDYNDSSAFVIKLGDNMFCMFFFFEIVMRWTAFKVKQDALHDFWFVFDLCLVASMVWETWVLVIATTLFDYGSGKQDGTSLLRLFRIARVARVSRASRLVQAFPELLLIVNGILGGMRSVLAVLLLMVSSVYVFGIIFTMLLRDTGVADGVFDHLADGMNRLLVQVLSGPDPDLMASLLAYHWMYYLLFIVFLVIVLFTMLNLLIGILCDVVSSASDDAKEKSFATEVEAQITRLTAELDGDMDGYISAEEFEVFFRDPEMMNKFDELGVDIVGVADFARFIYTQCDNMSLKHVMSLVALFRGGKTATVGHVANLMRFITEELVNLESRLSRSYRESSFIPTNSRRAAG